jgi:hypothetical protein
MLRRDLLKGLVAGLLTPWSLFRSKPAETKPAELALPPSREIKCEVFIPPPRENSYKLSFIDEHGDQVVGILASVPKQPRPVFIYSATKEHVVFQDVVAPTAIMQQFYKRFSRLEPQLLSWMKSWPHGDGLGFEVHQAYVLLVGVDQCIEAAGMSACGHMLFLVCEPPAEHVLEIKACRQAFPGRAA